MSVVSAVRSDHGSIAPLQIVHTISELRQALSNAPKPILVPTMGNLHAGHLSLVEIARTVMRPVVVTIFVNRLQFGPSEDFDCYPRTLTEDCEQLASAGCDIVFAPTEEEMYPDPYVFRVQPPAALANVLEGQYRPGFFTGVCTAVLKLFQIALPRAAMFGKKDYQQLLIIRDMVRQWALPVEVIGAETIRDGRGLALSSRNGYLTPAEREQAMQLYATLQGVAAALHTGRVDWRDIERQAVRRLVGLGWKPDYVAI